METGVVQEANVNLRLEALGVMITWSLRFEEDWLGGELDR